MKKLPAIIVFLLLSLFQAAGQAVPKSKLTGTVVEEENAQPVVQAGVQLLSPADSSMVTGTVTDADGRFSLVAAPGDYILKVTFIGFAPNFRNVHKTLSTNDLDVGSVVLTPDALFLQNAVVTAKAPPVTIIEDTVVYNAAAYRVAEDATLEELLKKIPGLEITGGKQITLHGKEIKQLLVGGKRFFGGDVKTGLQNISADMVENIRAYERESDMARLAGIEDGEEEAVLDITVKKNALNNWRNRLVLGGGDYDRYLFRANATKISKKQQISVIANSTNAVPAGLSKSTSKNVLGSGSAGDSYSSDAGVTFSNETKKLSSEGSIQFSRVNKDALSNGRSETVHATSVSYANGITDSDAVNNRLRSSLNLEWKLPNSFTLIFNPTLNFDTNDNRTNTITSSFKKDPYTTVADCNPFDHLSLEYTDDPYKAIRVNTTNNIAQTVNKRLNASASVQLVKRFDKPGRSGSVRTAFGLSTDDEISGHDYTTRYYKIKNHPDSARLRKQYLEETSPSRWMSAQLSYSEPLAKKLYLQFVYTFSLKASDSRKDFYSLQNGGFTDWKLVPGKDFASSLPAGYETTFDDALSASGRYLAFSNRVNLNLRYFSKKLNVTGGVNFLPQNTVLNYVGKTGADETVRTHVLNVSPQITVRIKKGKNKQFMLNYRGNGTQPSMYNLMPVANGTQPTNVHYGNPYLKPAFVETMKLNYNVSNLKKQNSFVAGAVYTTTKNAVCNSTEYDPDSGVRTQTPKNIDGNWKAIASVLYNKTLRDNRFSVSTHTSGEYQNSVNYLYNTKLKVDETNLTNRLMFRELADISFRNDWFEVLLSGGGDWTDEKSLLRPDMNQTPYSVNLGLSTDISFPWKMHLAADFTGLAQRGYVYDELNRNYYLLNARATQSILKGKGTLRLDIYDILGQTTNLVRNFSAERRSITTYNGINSYALLRFVYKINQKKKPTSGPSKSAFRATQKSQLTRIPPLAEE